MTEERKCNVCGEALMKGLSTYFHPSTECPPITHRLNKIEEAILFLAKRNDWDDGDRRWPCLKNIKQILGLTENNNE